MKNSTFMFACLLVLACRHLVQAQSADAAVHRTNTQIINFILDFQEQRIIGVAEIMPAEKFSFAPTTGAFKGVRTFGEELKHIAADNFMLGAGILGEQPPVDVGVRESGADNLRTKPEIIAYVKESFAYMHRAAASIDDANHPIPTPDISPWPVGTATRLGVAIEDCVHTWDHYGQLVEYLRMNNIIPPGSK
jgi:hypothetical protein